MQSRATTSTRPSPYAEIFEPITMRVVLQRQSTLRLKSTQTAILNVKFVFLFVRKQKTLFNELKFLAHSISHFN